MEHSSILLPVILLVFHTFVISIWMVRLRFLAVKRGEIDPRYFKLNRGGKVPDYLAKVTQNYDNLLELPLLFYVLVTLLIVSANVELAQVVMAWLFVGLRLGHTAIHTTSNKLLYRLTIFGISGLVLLLMWVLFFVRVLHSVIST